MSGEARRCTGLSRSLQHAHFPGAPRVTLFGKQAFREERSWEGVALVGGPEPSDAGCLLRREDETRGGRVLAPISASSSKSSRAMFCGGQGGGHTVAMPPLGPGQELLLMP